MPPCHHAWGAGGGGFYIVLAHAILAAARLGSKRTPTVHLNQRNHSGPPHSKDKESSSHLSELYTPPDGIDASGRSIVVWMGWVGIMIHVA